MQSLPKNLETFDSMWETDKRLEAVEAAKSKLIKATKRTMAAAMWVNSEDRMLLQLDPVLQNHRKWLLLFNSLETSWLQRWRRIHVLRSSKDCVPNC